MSNREVHKLRAAGSEALYCFYMIGQCHPHPVAKKVCMFIYESIYKYYTTAARRK